MTAVPYSSTSEGKTITPVAIGEHKVGPGNPTYLIGEIGINHNGDVELAKQLMDVSKVAGAQAVKFQKRNPEVAVPEHQKSKPRSTPWGEMTYLEYKYRVEFEDEQYTEIDRYAKELGLQWFASPWDVDSVNFLEKFDAVTHKVASASITDVKLLEALRAVMNSALDAGGTSFDSLYVNVNGASGYFDRSLNAYGRAGEPCPRCEREGKPGLIVREPWGGRSSYRCSWCQRRPRGVLTTTPTA